MYLLGHLSGRSRVGLGDERNRPFHKKTKGRWQRPHLLRQARCEDKFIYSVLFEQIIGVYVFYTLMN